MDVRWRMYNKKTLTVFLILISILMVTMGATSAVDVSISDEKITFNDSVNETISLSDSAVSDTNQALSSNNQNSLLSPSQNNLNSLSSDNEQSNFNSNLAKSNNLRYNSPLLYASIDDSEIANLGLNITVDSQRLLVDNTFSYTITVSNNGPSDATNVTVTGLQIPDDIEILSSNVPYSDNIWSLGEIKSNGNITFYVTAIAHKVGIFNTIFLASSEKADLNQSDNYAVVMLIVDDITPTDADLEVNVTMTNTVKALGDTATILVTVKNNGPSTATGINVTGALPTGLSLVSYTGEYIATDGRWYIPELPVNVSTTLSITFRIDEYGIYNFNVTANGSQEDLNIDNNYGHVTIGLYNNTNYADLGITIVADNSNPYVNETFTYIINVENNGPDNATNIIITTNLPSLTGLELIDATEGYDSTTGTWTLSTLNAGATSSLVIIVKPTILATYDMQVSVDSNQIDNISDNNHDNTVVVVNETRPENLKYSDLGVTLTSLVRGDTVRYTARIYNNGPNNATNVVLKYEIPDGLEMTTSNPKYNTTLGGWRIPQINAKSTSVVSFTLKIKEYGTYTNIVTVYSNETDKYVLNNTASNEISYEKPTYYTDLGIITVITRTPTKVDEIIEYTVGVINNGPDNATNITIKSILPTGLTLIYAGPDYNETSETFFINKLVPGDAKYFTVRANLTEYGTYTYTASLQGAEQDNYTYNNTATVTLTLLEKTKLVDLSISVSANTTNTTVDSIIEYTITVKNNGEDNATNVTIWNLLPTELKFLSSNTTYNTTGNYWLIEQINTGETILINFTTNATSEGSYVLNLTVNSTELDTNPTDNSANIKIEVYEKPILGYIIVGNITGVINTETQVQVVVLTTRGETVKDGNITINLNGKEYNQTVENGVAIVTITIPETVGLYNATVTYNGTVGTNNTNITVNATPISESGVNIITDTITGQVGENVTVNVTVTDNTGVNMTNGTVIITIGNIEYNGTVTNGTAQVNITLPSTTGINVVGTKYVSDEVNGTGIAILNVIPIPVNLTAWENITTGNAGEVVNILFNVTDEKGGNVTGGTVTITINKTSYIANVENGIANLTVILPENPGEYNITAKYLNNEITAEENITLNVTQAKIGNLIVTNVTGIINTNLTVTVLAIDVNGKTVKEGNIRIIVNNTEYNATVNNGVAYVQITIPSEIGLYNATVTYNGTYGINSTNITVNATPLTNKPSIIITVDNINGTTNTNVSVNITVQYANGENLTNGTINFTVNGVTYNTNLTNGTAQVNITLPNTPGIYLGELNFTDEENNITTIVPVFVSQGNVTLTPLENITTGSAGEVVNILFNVTDLLGENVTVGTVTITINNTNYLANVIDGIANITTILPLDIGEYNITAKYTYEDINAEANITLNVTPAEIGRIIVGNITNTIGLNTTVTVVILDINDKPVQEGNITITINNTNYTATVNNGVAYVTVTTPYEVGMYNATVTYNGSYGTNSTNITVNATPLTNKPSIIIKTNITNGTAYENLTVNITVQYENGENLTNGTVNFTINGVPYSANVTNGTALINITLPGTPGIYIAEINYTGEDENATTITPIFIYQGDVNLTPWENIRNGTSEEKVNILFNVTDIMGENITEGTVTITINNTNFVANVVNGIANVSIIMPKEIGEYNITATYNGNGAINTTNITLNVIPSKIKEIIVGNITGVINSVVNVPVVALDEFGEIIKEGTINITVNGSTYLANITNGVAYVQVKIPSSVGEYSANVTYNGSYGKNNTIVLLNATQEPSSPGIVVGLETITGHIRENLTVNVTVHDTNGVNMTNGTVNITINGVTYSANVTNGSASVNITLPSTSGLSIADVVYLSEEYNGVTNAIVNVTALPVTLTALENTTTGRAGETKEILFNVTDSEGINVTDGTVTIIVNGASYVGEVINGTANVTIVLPNTPDEYNVTAKYLSGDGTISDTVNITLNVTQADININIANITGVINSNMTVLVSVVDVNGFVVKSGNITILVNGSEFNGTVTDGISYINITIPETVGIYNATVIYNGSINAETNITVNATPLGSEPSIIIGLEDLPINGTTNSNLTVNITVKYSDNTNVTNGTINLTINGVPYSANVTNGTAQINITLPNTPGLYLGELNYTNETDTIINTLIPVIVSQSPVNISPWENITTTTTGSTVEVLFNVTDVFGENVTVGLVILNISGATYIGEVVDGLANITITAPNTPDEYNITAKYIYEDISAEANITLNVTSSEIAEIIIGNITGVINTNVTVPVIVIDINGNLVKSGNITIYINGSEYNATLTDGVAWVEVTIPSVVGFYTDANVSYTGIAGENFTSITVNATSAPSSPGIIIGLDTIKGHIRENITVNVTVKDTNGVNMTNGTVNITINGVTYSANVTNGTAQVNITLPGSSGLSIADVVYIGEEYSGVTNAVVNVTALPVTLVAQENITNGSAGSIVEILFNVTDSEGVNVTDGTVTIVVNGSSYIGNVVDGIANVTVTLPYEAGVYENITATYLSGDRTVSDTVNITLNVTQANIILNAGNITGIVNSNMTVLVSVVDVNGFVVKEGNITIIVNGSEFNGTVTDGIAYINITIPEELGIYNATVIYNGTVNTELNITVTAIDGTNKPGIVITVDPIIGKAHETVEVNITVKDTLGNNITNGTINFTINGNTYPVNVTNGTAKVNITLPGTIGTYIGELNYTNDENNITLPVPVFVNMGNVTLTPRENITNGSAGEKVNILFNVTDAIGENITVGIVILNINGTSYIADVNNGLANISVIMPQEIGEYNITAIYLYGDVNTTANITLNVTSANVGYIFAGNVSGIINTEVLVPVTVLDENGYVIKEGNVSIYVNGKNYTAIVKDGIAWVNLTIPSLVGTYPAEVNYTGDAGELNTDITVTALSVPTGPSAVINANDITGEINEVISMPISVTDNNGVNLENGEVTVTINGVSYTGTVSSGVANVDVTLPGTPGLYVVTIDYTNGTLTATKQVIATVTGLKVTLTPLENITNGSAGEKVNILFNVTYSDGTNVDSGIVTIKLNDTNYIAEVKDGVANVSLTLPLVEGIYENITATYTNVDGSTAEANITLNVTSANIGRIIAGNITGIVNSEVTSPIVVLDVNDLPIKSGNVTITVNGKNYTAEVKDGVAWVKVTIPDTAGTYDANATYNGTGTLTTEIYVIALDLSEDNTTEIQLNNTPINGTPGQTVNITVNVTYTNGTNVTNGTVNITINNNTFGPFNVTNGTAIINITLPDEPGEYPVNITYTGDDGNKTINTTATVIDTSVVTVTVKADNVSGVINSTKNVTITITLSNGSSITNGTITLNINGTIYIKNITSGIVEVEIKIPETTGNYTASVNYTCGNLSANNAFNVEAKTNETTDTKLAIISVNPIIGEVGSTVIVPVSVVDENNQPLNNGTVTITINGMPYPATVSNGIASVPVIIPASSTIAYISYTNGEVSNNTFAGVTAITPGPEPTPEENYADIGISITVNNTNPYINDTITYTVTVYNNGPDTAHNITVNNTLPASLELINYTGNYSNGWFIDSLDNGTRVNYLLTVKVTSVGIITETMTVNASEIDNNTDNNRATISIISQDIPTPPEPTPNETVKDTILIVENFTEVFGEGKYLTGVLKDTDGNVLAGQHVALNLSRVTNGQSKVYWVTTDYQGIFTLQINLSPGDYTAKGHYDGVTIDNTTYNPTDSGLATIKVEQSTSDKIPTIVYLSNYTGVYHQSEYLTGKLTDVYGNPLSRQTVGLNMTRLRTGENKIYYVSTNSTGDFKLLIQLRNDDYICTAIFDGTTRYMPSRSSQGTLNITL